MVYLAFIITCICAYLLGGINFGIIVTRIVAHKDIRAEGSGNAGATNVLRVLGTKPAVITLIGDFLKAAAAVGLSVLWFWLFDVEEYVEIGKITAALCAVLGHMYPLFFKFKGGKGVITCLGGVIVIHPLLAAIALAVFIAAVAITKYVSLGSILGCFSYFVGTLIYNAVTNGVNPLAIVDSALTAVVVFWVIFKHRANIKRLLSKTENKLHFKTERADGQKSESAEKSDKESKS